ncbi:condensation domain-containing protein [Streptomyces fuscigenes]|uniref:condensation domain-containing protein n=1 Tax=Streptomyces fuscigenes TaxID=1528880 RepID=UPI001F3F1D72|nr:condensation domain-containing protein [Streptomyces fuscigenes]MCF3964619.1 condensation domain-containing protein [Streptomyces fuscigenes]
MTELSQYLVRPGQVREWTLHPPALSAAQRAERDAVPPSYNQESHVLTMARLQERGVRTADWGGVAFEMPGEFDLEAFGRALADWIGRHETLRSGFRDAGGELHRFTLAREVVGVDSTLLGDFRDSGVLNRFLRDRLDAATHTLHWPSYVVETVQRRDSTTVLLAFDHTQTDGYTLFGLVHEIHEIYRAARDGRPPVLPDTGSHVDYSHEQRTAAALVGREHPAVLRWERFIADSGGRPPGFPLPLGTSGEELLPQKSLFEWLLDPAGTDALTRACRSERTALPAGILAANALAAQRLGAPGPYRTVMPFHTRTRSEWTSSVGWFVEGGPVEIGLPDDCDFPTAVRLAQRSAREARQVARVPFFRVCELLGVDFKKSTPDPFSLLSYMDVRDTPGARDWAAWNARALLRLSDSGKACLWVVCTPEGLYMFGRYPDTRTAGATMSRYVRCVRDVLREAAGREALVGAGAARGALS